MSNNNEAYAVILITGGEESTVETESYQLLLTPALPEFGLQARLFQRRDRSGETWTEGGRSPDSSIDRLKDEVTISETGEIMKYSDETRRLIQARLLGLSAKGSGNFLVPLTSEDIDTLVNVSYPELPESVIAKAVEVLP